jgi:nicotinamidase-related amidase
VNSIVDLRAYSKSTVAPTLVLVDLQQEYLATPRALAIPDVSQALANCRAALAKARAAGIPVAFVRWVGRSPFFNPATPFCRWIDGFEPTGADMVFERDRPSCYASKHFAEVMTLGGGNFILAGFAGEAACLSTMIDAFHRDHSVTYLADASASHAMEGLEAAEVHRIIARLAGLYGTVTQTERWLVPDRRSFERKLADA